MKLNKIEVDKDIFLHVESSRRLIRGYYVTLKDEDFNYLNLFRSLITLVLSGIIFSSTIINPLVSHQLIESDILNNSRYAIVSRGT